MELQKTVFEDAKKLMQDGKTWCAGVYSTIKETNDFNPDTGLRITTEAYCTVGAIRMALTQNIGCDFNVINPGGDGMWPYLKIIRDVIHAEYPEFQENDGPHSCTTSWNDYCGRKFEEIEAILDKSHARLQEMV